MDFNTIPTSGGNWENINSLINYNFNKIGISSAKFSKNVTGTYKGLFDNMTNLITSYPNPIPGDYAFVLDNQLENGFKMYYVNPDKIWTVTGNFVPSVDGNNYLKPVAINNATDILT